MASAIAVIYAVYKGGKRFVRFNWYKVLVVYLITTLFIFGTNFTYTKIFKQHHRDRFEILLGLKTDKKI